MAPSPDTLYLRAGRMITGWERQVIADAAVLVERGRIAAAGTVQEVPPPAPTTALVVEYPNGTLLPGLIEAHVHLTFRRGETTVAHLRDVSEERALLRGVQAAQQIVRAGVTTVRDCATRGRLGQALRDGVADGLFAGPRILAAGRPITTTAGHLWGIGHEADGTEAIRRAVRQVVKDGSDLVKVCATGGGMTPGSIPARAQYSADELRALVEDAHRLGKPVAAHVHGTEGIANAVAAGVDTVEHVSWTDRSGKQGAVDSRLAEQMARQGTFANIASNVPRQLAIAGAAETDPSLAVSDTAGPRPVLARWEGARQLIAAGVAVCFSTDSIYGNWDDWHDLTYLAQGLVRAGGFAPLHVIEMLTATPARAIGWGDRLGTIQAGKLADLLVVEGNPIEDIAALHQVRAVYQAGRPVAL